MIGKTVKETLGNINKMQLVERLDFVRENKEAIMEQKKSEFKIADVVGFQMPKSTSSNTVKLTSEEIREKDSLEVVAIGNLSMYLDSHWDVQGNKCWSQSLKNIDLIFHAKNHDYSTDGIIGEMKDIYMQEVRLDKLGITSHIKTGKALVFESEVHKELSKSTHFKYGKGLIKQHSVGMYYIKLKLAMNSKNDEDEDEYKVWKKYIDKVINKEEAENLGIFFYVEESKLIEISAVTRGSNPITPTLNVKQPDGTYDNSSNSTLEKKQPINYDYLLKNI